MDPLDLPRTTPVRCAFCGRYGVTVDGEFTCPLCGCWACVPRDRDEEPPGWPECDVPGCGGMLTRDMVCAWCGARHCRDCGGHLDDKHSPGGCSCGTSRGWEE